MKKIVEVTVDIKIARLMLTVAGYGNVSDMSDDEVFEKALSMNEEYGVKYKIMGNEKDFGLTN